MNADGNSDSAAILASLLKRFLADQRHGELAPLVTYQNAYPGYEELVAAHYAAVHNSDGEEGESAEPVTTLGPYRILRELGRGGQAVVYLAQDDKLDRRVALKVLTLGAALSDLALRRFRREAELASRLDDPGICPIYDVGNDRGTLWIAMRFVEGETLAQKMATAHASTRAQVLELVHLIESVARTLHAAHEAGIVHRDVKPGNLMVTPDGQPVILDFGLARDLHAGATVLTQTGGRFGTPQYMSPEQLSGEPSLVDRRTDVWALGVTLYECLTRHTPFDGPTPERVQSQILTAEPARPGRRNTHVPRDLEVVLEKSLEKDPRRRYPTALAFADDLARVRTNQPIAARPLPFYGHALRWARRKPAAAALVVVIALAVPALSALGGYLLSKRDVMAVGATTIRLQDAEKLVDDGFFRLLQASRRKSQTPTDFADREAARDSFLAALEKDPTDVLAVCGLALTRMRLYRNEAEDAHAALEVLEERATDFEGDPEFLSMKAYLLGRTGGDAEAAVIEAGLEHGSGAVRLLMEGMILLATASVGNLDAGDAAFHALLRARLLAPPRQIFHVMCVRAAGKSRQDDEVVTDLVETLLILWPESAQAWLWVGHTYFDRDPEQAARAFERAVELDGESYEAHALLGFTRNRLGQTQRAIASVKAALAMKPDYALAHAYLGFFLCFAGDLDKAESELRTAVDLDPHWSRSQAWLSMVLRAREDLDGAVEAANKAVELDPGDGGGHDQLAMAHRERKDYDQAAAAMQATIETNPPGWAAAGRVAWMVDLYEEAGQPDKAEAWMRRAITQASGGHGLCIRLVRRLEATGRHAEVSDVVGQWRQTLERATEVHPEHPAAWNRLAWFLVHPGLDREHWDPEAALDSAHQAVDLGTDTVWSPWTFEAFHPYQPLNALARALFVNGRVAEAVQAQERAVAGIESAGQTGPRAAKFRERLEEYQRAAREH